MLTKIVRDLFQSMFPPRGAKDKRAFHIVGIMPSGKTLHAMKGLTEVMESVAWGLRQLGYSAHIAVNDIARDRTNIIFGAQLLQPKFIEGLPAGTVIYNLEQVIDLDLFENPVVRAIAAHCHIWEYSEPQVQKWIQLGAAAHRVIHVPIGWSPTLQRIVKPQVQDIDVLIYGMPSALRAKVFNDLCFQGVVTVFVCGLYGRPRDELIARSKIIVNINSFEKFRIFEIVRVSYLLANGKAVVANVQPDRYVEPDIAQAVAMVALDDVPQTCIDLLADDVRRVAMESKGISTMHQRSIVPILQDALRQSGIGVSR